MVTNVIQGEGIQAYVLELNVLECNTIKELEEKALAVVRSHKEDNKKKLYFSDDDYKRVIQVCHALTGWMNLDGDNDLTSIDPDLIIEG